MSIHAVVYIDFKPAIKILNSYSPRGKYAKQRKIKNIRGPLRGYLGMREFVFLLLTLLLPLLVL